MTSVFQSAAISKTLMHFALDEIADTRNRCLIVFAQPAREFFQHCRFE